MTVLRPFVGMRWAGTIPPQSEKRWRRYAPAMGRSSRVDETYVRIRGEWRYLYRAVDQVGRTVDFRLSARPARQVWGRIVILTDVAAATN